MQVASDLITNRPVDDGAPQKLRGDDTTMVKVIEVLPCRCPQNISWSSSGATAAVTRLSLHMVMSLHSGLLHRAQRSHLIEAFDGGIVLFLVVALLFRSAPHRTGRLRVK